MRAVIADWLGRGHVFRLPLAGLFAIEDDCGKPACDVLSDLATGTARIEQLEAVVYHALICSGMSALDSATMLDETRRSSGHVQAAVTLCVAILAHALDAPPAKGAGGGDPINRVNSYRAGFAMGIQPAAVDAMMLRDFLVALEAFTAKGGGLSEAEKDELWEWVRED